MTNKNVADIEEKFFFNQHIFDEPDEPEEDPDAPPPPPVFSEQELEAAKSKAFQEGHSQATQEAKDSHSQQLVHLTDAILKDMSSLFAQEEQRERLYEQEAVRLTLSAVEKLFPYYFEAGGTQELQKNLEAIIEAQSGQKTVQIFVHTSMIKSINELMDTLRAKHANLSIEVAEDEALGTTACRLNWKDGGAIYDPEAMAGEILRILKDGLASANTGRHDSIEERDNQDSDISDPAPEEKPDE